jgi:hypothetical protein
MRVQSVALLEKRGGRSGTWVAKRGNGRTSASGLEI